VPGFPSAIRVFALTHSRRNVVQLVVAYLFLVRPMKRVAIAVFCMVTAVAVAKPPPVGPHEEPAREVAIFAPKPVVPAEARARHLSGAGVCVVYVRPDGTVERAEMLQSTGQPVLDKASIDAFSRWRFVPSSVKKVKLPIRYTGNYTKPKA
jgi:TonB family protein